jgi:beta-glucosidase
VNPSARLPVTIPNSENEIGFTTLQYPGVQLEGYYTEGLYIDYRWYNLHGIRPAFSFGHGLSYTKFEYIFVSANELAVVVNVKNVGKVIGAEVAQLYLTLPQDAKAPILQLKGFIKTNDLQPGETQKVVFELNSRLLSTWCSVSHSWKLVSGEYKYAIGASVEDIRLNGILFTH